MQTLPRIRHSPKKQALCNQSDMNSNLLVIRFEICGIIFPVSYYFLSLKPWYAYW